VEPIRPAFRRSKIRRFDKFGNTPRAGWYSTVCVPPPIATLPELAEWFRTKPGVTNSARGFIQTLGEEEVISTLTWTSPRSALPRILRYFYRASPAALPTAPVSLTSPCPICWRVSGVPWPLHPLASCAGTWPR
jgi:hypothetical protein